MHKATYVDYNTLNDLEQIFLKVRKRIMSDIYKFMEKAIEYAKTSAHSNSEDVPVGCIIVKDNEILSYGFNTREHNCHITGHAEIQAIETAEKVLGDHRLHGCKMFVTLEPCPMCAGAIRAAQIEELYFGAYNLSDGSAGTVYNLLYPQVKVFGGIKKSDCESLLKEFFSQIRKNK